MPWRSIKDEFSKFKWIDHEGRVYQGTPFVVEPDATAKTVFIASVMHAQMQLLGMAAAALQRGGWGLRL